MGSGERLSDEAMKAMTARALHAAEVDAPTPRLAHGLAADVRRLLAELARLRAVEAAAAALMAPQTPETFDACHAALVAALRGGR